MVGVPLPVPGSLLVEEPDVGHPEEAVQEPNHHLFISGGVNQTLYYYMLILTEMLALEKPVCPPV